METYCKNSMIHYQVLELKIPNFCASGSNATSSTTTHTEKPLTTKDVNTTGNNNNLTSWTPTSSNDTSGNPHYSETTRFSNSSFDTTERVPSGNSTERYTPTTPSHAVRFVLLLLCYLYQLVTRYALGLQFPTLN